MVRSHHQTPSSFHKLRAVRHFVSRRLLRFTVRTGSGILVSMAALFGYSLGGAFVLTAFLKSFFPEHVGAWISTGNRLAIGFTSSPPAAAHELLGSHYLGAALIAGATLLAATHILIRRTAAASARIYIRTQTPSRACTSAR
jgi:hypothetical protein